MAKWKQYQEEVAALLGSLGFAVTIEAKLHGARGVHAIDVHATHTAYGFPVNWIVECKYWKTAVPKEKVLVLSQIAADVGADRGFLLSESGFQSGAILATRHTNVTLTSLPDLRENMQGELTRLRFAQIAQRSYVLEKLGHRHFHPGLFKRADGMGDRFLKVLSRIFTLKSLALPCAQAGDFPVRMYDRSMVADPSAFVAAAQQELEAIADELEAIVAELLQPSALVPGLVEEFSKTVHAFLDKARSALSSSSPEEHDRACLEALTPMRLIGEQTDGLEFMLQPSEGQAMRVVMRALIEGPYLFVTTRDTAPAVWANAELRVTQSLAEFKSQVRSIRESTGSDEQFSESHREQL